MRQTFGKFAIFVPNFIFLKYKDFLVNCRNTQNSPFRTPRIIWKNLLARLALGVNFSRNHKTCGFMNFGQRIFYLYILYKL